MTTRLSCAIITKNEEKNLPDCLNSVSFADEIVVVDSGSNDQTVKIASDFGCVVFFKEWEGFGYQKQYAIDCCKHDWVLLIDADERIPSETREVIKKILEEKSEKFCAYSFPRKNIYMGKWIKHGGWWPDRIIRLFRKDSVRVRPVVIHESVIVNGPICHLKVPILHFYGGTLEEIIKKINFYSSLSAKGSFSRGKKSDPFNAFLRAFFGFCYKYFFRLGFMDGKEGLLLASVDAANRFFKYTKIWEREKRRESSSYFERMEMDGSF